VAKPDDHVMVVGVGPGLTVEILLAQCTGVTAA
jgi:hypothetical protein